jgi:hypothetical protein
MKNKLLQRIEELEKYKLKTEKDIWLLKNPRLYKFNNKVEFRIIDHYDSKESSVSYGMFSSRTPILKPVYRNEIGIIKSVDSECKEHIYKSHDWDNVSFFHGVPEIEVRTWDYTRYYNVEYEDNLILVDEQDIIKII